MWRRGRPGVGLAVALGVVLEFGLMAGERKVVPWEAKRKALREFAAPALPGGMELGEALEIYGRVVNRMTVVLSKCNGRPLWPYLTPSAISKKIKVLSSARMRLAVEHVTGRPFAELALTMFIDRFCELVMGGMEVVPAITLLGMEKQTYQFYNLFHKRMYRLTGRSMHPGEFRKMVLAGRADPFAPEIRGKKWINHQANQ